MSTRRLRRSRTDRFLFGVCGGLGEFTGIDPTIIRVIWVLASVVLGAVITGIVIYLVFWVIVPEAPH